MLSSGTALATTRFGMRAFIHSTLLWVQGVVSVSEMQIFRGNRITQVLTKVEICFLEQLEM